MSNPDTHLGTSAVSAVWISSIIQAGCVLMMFGLVIVSIERLAKRARPGTE